jgi:NhaA family Na+:H+ antiporter
VNDERNERLKIEKAMDEILSPLNDFIRSQSVSAVFLLLATLGGLMMANSGYSEIYHAIGDVPLTVGAADWRLEMSLHHWVNHGLMVVFFFMLGLEIKRELLAGELREMRTAAVVIASALGGMVVPAAIFAALNAGGAGLSGWAIPMATDAAFALGALALLAGRAPAGLSAFLVGLAIIDDIGAVLVVAIFYTESLSMSAGAWAVALMVALFVLNVLGVRRVWPYLLLGLGLWFAVLSSGVHATIAGVVLALAIPARARVTADEFMNDARGLLDDYEQDLKDSDSALGDERRHEVALLLRRSTLHVTAPLQRWEQHLHLPVAYVVVPLFAFLNAGIKLDEVPFVTWFTEPLSLGIILGLVLGKFIGILGAAWVVTRSGVGELPHGVALTHIAGAGLLAGMGFTMSLFIAALAFPSDVAMLFQAKTGVFVASSIAGVLGFGWLWLVADKR